MTWPVAILHVAMWLAVFAMFAATMRYVFGTWGAG
jgi:hypothetical protein